MITLLGYQPTSGDPVRIIGATGAGNKDYVGMSGIALLTPHGLRVNFDLSHEDADGLLLASVIFTGDEEITLERIGA